MDKLAFYEKQMLASPSDLPLNFHPAAVRYAKWRRWSNGRSAELVGVAAADRPLRRVRRHRPDRSSPA